MTAALLELDGVHCTIAGNAVVRGVSFALARGELAALLGPSGCGKTTCLRAIAGFQPLAAGTVTLRGIRVGDAAGSVPPERRGIGFVFQDLALYPHLTVADNVAFGLHRLDRTSRAARRDEALERLRLEDLAQRYPHELSGGQQQRVAVARALAPEPDLLLLDEPLSSLDARLRVELRESLRTLLRSLGVAALLVTHDQDEAFAFADHIGVMRAGRIEQWATPFDLYHRPATPFVADFVGEGRLIAGVARGGAVETALGTLRANGGAPREGARVRVLVRPDDLLHDEAGAFRVRVIGAAFRGAETLYTLALPGGEEVCALFPSHLEFAPGTEIGIATDIEHVVVFAGEQAP
ncbi:MAG TPA: ABC transporter ATP-binding protein [Xanthomonadales bacterium]|nr:ABC transporter ATP-binding protein [Xanthomonadales bacterium]